MFYCTGYDICILGRMLFTDLPSINVEIEVNFVYVEKIFPFVIWIASFLQ